MRQKTGMVTEAIGGDAFLIVPTQGADTAKVLELNGSGGFVWELLQTEQTFDTLLEALLQEYDVPRPQAQSDLSAFLSVIQPYIE